ncbi:MAG: DUF2121 domain-containing protein [Methanobacteriaceae archaeon]|nr:DUF2121 domain-containing protein [Methanobacteriaceae archaeon]
MSLIISYISSKGCVMIGDKRSIGFLGDEKTREQLEEMLYSGAILTTEALMLKAKELGITLKITDDSQKVRKIGDVLVGEVKYRTPFETRRKRIYGTTNGYHLVKLTGSNIDSVEEGESSIVVFGNLITKKMANYTIQKHWKSSSTLEDVGKLFKKVMDEVTSATPSVSPEYHLFTVNPQLDKNNAKKLLRTTIVQDVKDLEKWRADLKDKMVSATREMEIASKIMTEGLVGKVKNIEGNQLEVILSKGVLALDIKWNILARSGQKVQMTVEDPEKVLEGDMVVITNENLGIGRSGANLICEVILCNE